MKAGLKGLALHHTGVVCGGRNSRAGNLPLFARETQTFCFDTRLGLAPEKARAMQAGSSFPLQPRLVSG